MKTEEFWNPEHIVEKFWKGLADGKIYARKCKECGAIEFPPHLACNTCGYHETEWTELSGKGQLISFVRTGILNARLELEDKGLKYVCGEVKLDEGPAINAVILGIAVVVSQRLLLILCYVDRVSYKLVDTLILCSGDRNYRNTEHGLH